ncbi:MAG: enoyl-CoA hydratase/isomerase family protein [Actinobacteria bacterium]|nr:enoyl-CoA hydratase/isomerase family protein [Actinomycetota bacterium]
MALVKVEGDTIVSVTLERPEARNALSVELCDELTEAFEGLSHRDDVRAVILQGSGKTFCAGADFAAVSGPEGEGFLPSFERMLSTIAEHRHPVLASIHGAALGGGLQLATVCDFRITADDAKLGIPSTRLGIVVNFENVERLALLAGVAVAKEVLMTGRIYSGAEAAAAGLVTRSVPATELAGECSRFAGDIATLAPLSVRGAKAAIEAVVRHLSGARNTDPEGVAAVDRSVARAYGSEDLQEGIAAMSERRLPRFAGR